MKSKSRKYILTVASTYYKSENEKIDGKLKIDNEKIIFVASTKNTRFFKIEISISDISETIKKSSYGIIPNILIIKTNSQSFKFSLYAREHFLRVLEEIKSW